MERSFVIIVQEDTLKNILKGGKNKKMDKESIKLIADRLNEIIAQIKEVVLELEAEMEKKEEVDL